MLPINPYLMVLYSLMIPRNMNVRSLALQAGISPNVLYGLFRRNSKPTIDLATKMCSVFGIRLSDYVRIVEDEQNRLKWFNLQL